MSLYKQFEANPSLEREGVWYDYGDFRIKVRFAGGVNKAYTGLLETTMKPFRRLINQDMFPEERSKSLLMSVYAKTIVCDWHTAIKDENGAIVVDDKGETTWREGIENRNGDIVPCTPENVLETFKALPNLFLEVVNVATSTGNYRIANLEADGKN